MRSLISSSVLTLLLLAPPSEAPYVVVRKDGTRMELSGPPRLKGASYVATVRATGQLVSFPAGEVDLARTAQANRPEVAPANPGPTPSAERRVPGARVPLGDQVRLTVSRQKAQEVLNSASGSAKAAPGPGKDAADMGTDAGPARSHDARGDEVVETPEHVDNEGRGEDYWRSRAAKLRRNLSDAEAELKLAQAAAGRWERDVPVYGDAELQTWARELARLRNRVDRAQARLDRARLDADALGDEARRAGAYPGWIR